MTDQWLPSVPLVPAGDWASVCGCTPEGGVVAIADNIVITGAPGAITSSQNDKSLWALVLNDGTPAADFRIDRFDDTGALADSPMSIVRATGVVSFNDPVMLARDPVEDMEAATKDYVDAVALADAPSDGVTYARKNAAWQPTVPASGGTFTGGVAFTTGAIFAGPANLSVGGGAAGQVLSATGTGGMVAWANLPIAADAPSDGQFYTRQNAAWAVAPGGMTDAPNDGTAYARKSVAWAHLTHTDITDWTATLAPYALTASVPAASSTTPIMDGAAAVGVGATWARADHVHPTDTSRYAASNPSGYQTAAQVTAALPVASSTTPLMDGVAAIGTGTTWARADHVHPTSAMNDNRIINGDMRIDQRNNGASGTVGGYTVDRWQYASTQSGKGTWQRGGSGAVMAGGFPYWLTFTSASAYAVLAGDTFVFMQSIEADYVSDFMWGTASAQSVTFSFWVYCGLTGTFGGSIRNYASTRSYPFTYSIPTANTWTKIVLTIPGDTAGTWVTAGNGGAINLGFDLGTGATYRGPANAWAATQYNGATGSVSVVGTNGAFFAVTGVKLEVGNVATPYNRQSLAKSLADCQRYYIGPFSIWNAGYCTTGVGPGQSVLYPVTMRAQPTIVFGSPQLANCSALTIVNPASIGFGWTVTMTTTGGYIAASNLVTASAEL